MISQYLQEISFEARNESEFTRGFLKPCSISILQTYTDFHLFSVRTSKRATSLRHNGPRIWNSLPFDI